MIYFFSQKEKEVFALQSVVPLSDDSVSKLSWLFSEALLIDKPSIAGNFIGPKTTMVTPWSTNAVEITQNMGITGISRIERFVVEDRFEGIYDKMLFLRFKNLTQDIFDVDISPEPIKSINDIRTYNIEQGLSLSEEEIEYLIELSERIGRPLTDSEVFGFSQVNSEHCRHKIFNGEFIIDGTPMSESLFKLIRNTSEKNGSNIVSAYKDNVSFIKGPVVEQFAPKSAITPDYYHKSTFRSIISLKAETHNFPTTVEPFNGAATGSGGEIRDRMAGGKGSIPLIGTAVYMTSFPRLNKNKFWEQKTPHRQWLYQSPLDILIKASNGASDFGNKFGQPLIVGSVLTFEHSESDKVLGFDKVIMLAGGVGYGKLEQGQKEIPKVSDRIFILGGDNYRIGMGGAAVSSSDTGEFSNGIECNAVQRSNPEMQKRVFNVIRAFVESDVNTISSIHDHGAGGHLNCLAELVDEQGGHIDLSKLPLGDETLSCKEIIGNESQERMGLVISNKHKEKLEKIAERERTPLYDVGYITGNKRFVIASSETAETPLDLNIEALFENSPKTTITDNHKSQSYLPIAVDCTKVYEYLEQVLQLESVACKDWLTNKVDRCVGGKVAKQQCAGALQLPLNNVGVVALDYNGRHGIATSIGHSPVSALIDVKAGSQNSIAEALTNIIWAPIKNSLAGLSLSANWMWPCKNEGEDARLYDAVKSCSEFAINLGVNISTGKDSLSMTQKYKDKEVMAPGTVIISASGHCDEITKVVEPVMQKNNQHIYYINLSQENYKLGGSALGMVIGRVGANTPAIRSSKYFVKIFNAIQDAIRGGCISSGHDVSSGGLITTLLEMCFAELHIGAEIDVSDIGESNIVKLLFSENVGVVFQADKSVERTFEDLGIELAKIGEVNNSSVLTVRNNSEEFSFSIPYYRDVWYKTSYLLDSEQCGHSKAKERYDNYKKQPLVYDFPSAFTGRLPQIIIKQKPKAAVIREKGSNSEREMANSMYAAGFDVKDVHMTDLISGLETLEDVRFLGAVGGFSNSDVLGSAKGWAGAFRYNKRANEVLTNFFNRKDTLSLGICNGCQLFIELNLINPYHQLKARMGHNDSKKFDCAFTSVNIEENHSVMMKSLSGAKLGIWSANGEGKFLLPHNISDYNIIAKYAYDSYPASPNGSDYNVAMLASDDGRHLVSMPHFERSLYSWNWAHYPKDRNDDISPWIEPFVNAYNWMRE